MKIKKLLIANRGEIAVRIIRTCREMGIQTVAVYSEADRQSLFVRMADEAFEIGPAPSSESYLQIKKIINVAKKSGADAIHPGYGFLSEKAEFSQTCEAHGLIFIGPTPESISAMGDKVTARNHAQKAKVPMIPGTLKAVKNIQEVKKLAKEFGLPVLLKATAGGGGKGMRVVHKLSELESAFEMASSEAKESFHDERLYMEKYIKEPRHVEVQIACDHQGHGVFLFERECSMQRRHQKVIEESPSAYLRDAVRRKMANAALRLAKKIHYTGLGTIEFLVDADQNYYFLEMNTRLQVEHTVTEMVTGLDLVRLQIEIARGMSLKDLKIFGLGHTASKGEREIFSRGHAMECRIYAEDPDHHFMPSPGRIEWMSVPQGPGVRHDGGFEAGDTVSIYYDPLIAKLIVHALSRDQAIEKMIQALNEYQIGGLVDNVSFLKSLLNTPEFRSSRMHTQFIDQNPVLVRQDNQSIPLEVILGLAAFSTMGSGGKTKQEGHEFVETNWWRLGLEDALRDA